MEKLKKSIIIFIFLIICIGMISTAQARSPKKIPLNVIAYTGTGAGITNITPEGDLELLKEELNLNEESVNVESGELEAKPSLISPYDPVSSEEDEKPSLISIHEEDEESEEPSLILNHDEENSVAVDSNINYDACVVDPSPLYIMMQRAVVAIKLITFACGIVFLVLAVLTGIKKSQLFICLLNF